MASAWEVGFSSLTLTSPGFGHVTETRFPGSEQKRGAPLEALIWNCLGTAAAPRGPKQVKKSRSRSTGYRGNWLHLKWEELPSPDPSCDPSRSSSCSLFALSKVYSLCCSKPQIPDKASVPPLLWGMTRTDFVKKILFIFRVRGREEETEEEKHQSDRLPPVHAPSGTKPTTQTCAPTGNRTGDPVPCRMTPNQLNHTTQDRTETFY